MINNHIHSFGFFGVKLSLLFDGSNHFMAPAMGNFKRRGILAVDLKTLCLSILTK
ncbi:MAG: hypothetical protein LBT95_03905 [Treponema sp.]|nr:hypothetical protein [Treponema sp.]